jgi:hypothetical protein
MRPLHKHPLSILVLIASLVWGARTLALAHGRDIVEERSTLVTLTPSVHPRQLIYEDERVRIAIGHDAFEQYVRRRLADDPDPNSQARLLTWYEEIDTALHAQGTYTLNYREHRQLIAAMLERGEASLFDKPRQRQVHIIRVQSRVVSSDFSIEAQRFFHFTEWSPLPWEGTLFFQVRDGVS